MILITSDSAPLLFLCAVHLLDICSYLLAHLSLPLASPDLVMSVSQPEPREIWLLKINQSEPKIGHRLSPVDSQQSTDMFIGAWVRGKRLAFASSPFPTVALICQGCHKAEVCAELC